MNRRILASLEEWAKTAPGQPLNSTVSAHFGEADLPHDLKAAVDRLGEAGRAFAEARQRFTAAVVARDTALATKPLNLAAAKDALRTMQEDGHHMLGHYIGFVEIAHGIPTLVGAALVAARTRDEARRKSRAAELERALADLGFRPSGTVDYMKFGQHQTPISISAYASTHPDLELLDVRMRQYTPPYEVTAAAAKAAIEAAQLLVEIELEEI